MSPKDKTTKSKQSAAPEQDAPEMPSLYTDLLRVIDNTELSPKSAVSGFADSASDEIIEEHGFQPIGAYPKFLAEEDFKRFARIEFTGEDRVLLWVRDGGGLVAWERRAQAGTIQSLTVIFNGKVSIDVEFAYNGDPGWSFHEIQLPDALKDEPVHCCEIEKDGLLLFSGLIDQDQVILGADVITPVRFIRPGILEGWAMSNSAPGQDVFFHVRTEEGGVQKMRTGGVWDQEKFRRFMWRSKAKIETLVRVDIENLAGKPAARSPLWVYQSDSTGLLIGHPRRGEDDTILVTIVGGPNREHQPVSMIDDPDQAPEGLKPTEYLIDQPNLPPFHFKFRDTNTSVALPRSRMASKEGFILVSETGGTLGHLPSLAPLLDEL